MNGFVLSILYQWTQTTTAYQKDKQEGDINLVKFTKLSFLKLRFA